MKELLAVCITVLFFAAAFFGWQTYELNKRLDASETRLDAIGAYVGDSLELFDAILRHEEWQDTSLELTGVVMESLGDVVELLVDDMGALTRHEPVITLPSPPVDTGSDLEALLTTLWQIYRLIP